MSAASAWLAAPRTHRRRASLLPWGVAVTLPAIAVLLAFFVWPVAQVVGISFLSTYPGHGELTLDKYLALVTDPFYRNVAAATLLTVLSVTLLTVLLGYPAAYFLVRSRSRRKHIFFVAMVSPLMVSVVVRTFGWLMLLGADGPLERLVSSLPFVSSPVQLLFNRGAIIVGLTHILLPFMILAIAGTLASVDRRIEEAARVLGASPLRVLLHVTLPLSLPGVVAGCVLVFSLSLGAYLTPFFLGGGHIQLLATVVYDETLVLVDWPTAAALATVLLGGVLAILGCYVLVWNRVTRGAA